MTENEGHLVSAAVAAALPPTWTCRVAALHFAPSPKSGSRHVRSQAAEIYEQEVQIIDAEPFSLSLSVNQAACIVIFA